MKKNFYSSLILLLIAYSSIFAQTKEVIIVHNATTNRDSSMIKAIREFGGGTVYNVTEVTTTIITTGMLTQLNAADVVIMGRSIGSTDVSGAMAVWDQITRPVLSVNLWALRNNRAKWVNTDIGTNVVTDADTVLKAVILVTSDPVFAGLNNDTIDWWSGRFSVFGAIDAGNGTLLAKTIDNRPLFIRWAANTEFYTGAGHQALAERSYIGNGQDNSGLNYWDFTNDVKTVFFNELARLASIPTAIRTAHEMASQLSVYTSDGKISVSLADLRRVEIYSVSGKLLLSVDSKDSYLELNTSFNNGIYILKAYNVKGIATSKKLLVRK